MGAILEINNVSGGYYKEDVIKGISLGVNRGDFLVVMGPNGSGKTTLARNLPSTSSTSRTGDVSTSSIVPERCSSASRRMVSAGAISKRITATLPNTILIDASVDPAGEVTRMAKKTPDIKRKAAMTT